MSVRSVTPHVESHGLVITEKETKVAKTEITKTQEEVDRIALWKRWSKADARSSVHPSQRHGAVGAIVEARKK